MNDSLRTDIFVRYLPEAIACGCIYLASCKLNVPLPRHPAWWEMFSVSEDSVHEIALCLLRLYARPKPDVAALEAELAQLRKNQIEAREREIEQKKQNTTPGTQSDHSSGHVSPPTSRSSAKSNGLKKPEVKADPDDFVQTTLPGTILASALATAKAVAATLAAAKSGNKAQDESDDDPSTLSQSPKKPSDYKHHQHNISPEFLSIKNDRQTRESSNSQVRLRPAAYAINTSSLTNESEKRKHHKHRKYSKKHRRRSPTSSSSSSEHDHGRHRSTKLPNAYVDSRSRHYRSRNAQANDSASDSDEKRQELISSIKRVSNSKAKFDLHSSSNGSRSSSADLDGLISSSRHHGASPTNYNSVDHEKVLVQKYRSSGKLSSANGERPHHRHHGVSSGHHRDRKRR